MNGHLIVDENGQAKFGIFDSTASAADDWTERDIIPGSFRQESLDTNIVNRIVYHFGRWAGSKDPVGAMQFDHTASQSTYAFPGASDRILTKEFTTNWMDFSGWLYEDITADGTTIKVSDGFLWNFSGNRSDAWAAPSATQPVYLMLDSLWTPDVHTAEIVSCESLTRETDTPVQFAYVEPNTGVATTVGPFCGRLTYNNCTRGEFGTTKVVHTRAECRVYDITPIVKTTLTILGRFANGCPIITLDTHLDKMRYQIGDLVTVTWPKYMSYGLDGIDDSTKWEIIHKQVDATARPPRINWKLALAATSAPSPNLSSIFERRHKTEDEDRRSAIDDDVLTNSHVVSGCDVTKTAGLVGNIAAGTVSTFNKRYTIRFDTAYTYTASKDTYVSVDVFEGTFFYREVALADPAPLMRLTECFLGKVTTDAVEITAIDDTDVVAHPIPNITKIASRSLDDVQDGTNWKRVADVDGANQCTTASIAGLAITEAKLGAASVTNTKLGAGSVTESKLGALAVTEGKIGALAVTSGKLGANSVIAGKIAAGGVSASSQIANGVVDTDQIAALAVESAKIAANAVTAGKIAAGGVSASNQIANGIVDTDQLASLAITNAKINDNAIGVVKMNNELEWAAGLCPNAAFTQYTKG